MLGQASWQLPQLTFTILLKPERNVARLDSMDESSNRSKYWS